MSFVLNMKETCLIAIESGNFSLSWQFIVAGK
jgi:hypothetical protein